MVKLIPSHIKKIGVFRALQLGDLLCFIPAIRALRRAFPRAHIALIGLPWAIAFTNRFSDYFDSFIQFPGFPGLPEQPVNPTAVTLFLSEIQNEKFDLILQMQGNGTIINPLMELLGAKHSAGFYIKHDYCPNTELFLEYPEGISEIERHLLLMNFLGISSQGTDLEFPLSKKDEKDFHELNLLLNNKPYVCIHPGSRGLWRQWPAEYFAALGDYCFSQGLTVAITGTKDELLIANDVTNYMHHEAINTAGKTSLGAVGILIKNACALISNCTGVSHIASALKTPSIVISMDGEPERWAPLNRQLHRTIDWTKTPDYRLVLQEMVTLLSRDLL